MTLLVKRPLRELDLIERRMRRLFEDTFFGPSFAPPADVYETDDAFVVELEVAGFEEPDLEVELIDHTLVVKGEREETAEEEERTFRVHERLERSFERRFALPPDGDTDELVANFDNGILTVTVPKTAEAKPRKIEIART